MDFIHLATDKNFYNKENLKVICSEDVFTNDSVIESNLQKFVNALGVCICVYNVTDGKSLTLSRSICEPGKTPDNYTTINKIHICVDNKVHSLILHSDNPPINQNISATIPYLEMRPAVILIVLRNNTTTILSNLFKQQHTLIKNLANISNNSKYTEDKLIQLFNERSKNAMQIINVLKSNKDDEVHLLVPISIDVPHVDQQTPPT